MLQGRVGDALHARMPMLTMHAERVALTATMVELLDIVERGAVGHAFPHVEVAVFAAVAGHGHHKIARLLIVRGPDLKRNIDLAQRVDRDRGGTNWFQTVLIMLGI